MNIKTAAVTLALLLAPTLTLASGCSHNKEQQAMSCADGSSYDSATGTCVAVSA